MRLPERFTITIEGKRSRILRRHNITPNSLPHMISELLSGDHAYETADALQAYGLRVTVEVGTDQGDDGPD